jgi:predicted metal-dependent hydrolase
VAYSDPKQAPSSRERKSRRPPKRVPPGALAEPLRSRCDEPPPDPLRHAIAQFNAGEYFEQHETLELLWRDTRAPVRDLYHGILQIGVGLHHLRRGNFHGASVLLEEGLAKLRPFEPTCHAVDVSALVREATAVRERVIELGPTGIATFDWHFAPRIRFLESGEQLGVDPSS